MAQPRNVMHSASFSSPEEVRTFPKARPRLENKKVHENAKALFSQKRLKRKILKNSK